MKHNIFKILSVIIVIALSVAIFTACVPTKPDKAKTNLEEAGYSTSLVTSSDDLSAFVLEENQSAQLTATKGIASADGMQYINIVYFKTNDAAKTYYADLKKDKADRDAENKQKYEDGDITEEEYNERKKSVKIGRLVKTVWSGTPDAVKAAG